MNSIIVGLLLFICIGCGTSNASFITANPSTIYPLTTQTLSIECNIRPLLVAIKNIYVLQIEKTENGQIVSLVSVTEHGLVSDSGFDGSRMSASGDLNSTRLGPYIRLAIDKPDKGDKGTYTCSASTTDKTGTLVNLSYQIIVNMADSIPDQLMNVVSNLTLEISSLRKENILLQANLSDFQIRIKKIENSSCDCRLDELNGIDFASVAQAFPDIQANITHNLITYESRFFDLTNEIAGLQSNQSDLSNDVTKFSQQTQRLISDVVYASLKYDHVEQRLKIVENISSEQYSEIAQLSAERRSLAFSYMYPDIDQTTSIVYFRSKLMDNGSSYNSQNGIFTSPRGGLYLFTLHIATEDGSLDVAIKVREDLVAYAATSFSNGVQQGSTSAVVRMSKGDTATVKVSKVLKTPVHLQKDACSFSGVFLGPE